MSVAERKRAATVPAPETTGAPVAMLFGSCDVHPRMRSLLSHVSIARAATLLLYLRFLRGPFGAGLVRLVNT